MIKLNSLTFCHCFYFKLLKTIFREIYIYMLFLGRFKEMEKYLICIFIYMPAVLLLTI